MGVPAVRSLFIHRPPWIVIEKNRIRPAHLCKKFTFSYPSPRSTNTTLFLQAKRNIKGSWASAIKPDSALSVYAIMRPLQKKTPNLRGWDWRQLGTCKICKKASPRSIRPIPKLSSREFKNWSQIIANWHYFDRSSSSNRESYTGYIWGL